MTSLGLYYPYFDFPNDSWVKLSALYWNRMYRIVPDSYKIRNNSHVVKELSSGEDSFIKSLHPDYECVARLGFLFSKFIENNLELLQKFYSTDPILEGQPQIINGKKRASKTPKLFYIYTGKLSDELKRLLIETHLGAITITTLDPALWIGVHPRLANVYMAALATNLARQNALEPVAAERIQFITTGDLTIDRLAEILLCEDFERPQRIATEEEIEDLYARIAMQMVLPKNIKDISIDQIIKFREKYPAELGRFQQLIKDSAVNFDQLKGVSNPELIKDFLHIEFKQKVQPELDQLKDAMQSTAIETVEGILGFQIGGAGLLRVLQPLTHIAPEILCAVDVGLSFYLFPQKKRLEMKKNINSSNVSYLLRVHEDFAPTFSPEWFIRNARKVIYGV